MGRCPDCGQWGTLEEQAAAVLPPASPLNQAGVQLDGIVPTSPAKPLTEIDAQESARQTTGISELDRVLGGGLVPGSVVLLAGEPGVGKSTMLLKVAASWVNAEPTRTALYVTAEESAGQVRLRAERTDCVAANLFLAAESNLDVIFGHVNKLRPSLLIIDSVQTMIAPGVEGVAGGVSQSRAVTAALTTLAKTKNIPVVLVGHVTKDGNVAGPRVLEHLVDVVLNFEGDKHSALRFLRGIKNRFGATDELGCFEQTGGGIAEVADPSGLFLSTRGEPTDGSAITVTMDGRRALLAEVQALVVDSGAKTPRRAVTGIDTNRLLMILAVLRARGGINTAEQEVYVATVGGMRITEPAADLATALAAASCVTGTVLPARMVVIGEVGLSGEIRQVANLQRRLQEAARLGYTKALVPPGDYTLISGITITPVSDMQEALALTGCTKRRRRTT